MTRWHGTASDTGIACAGARHGTHRARIADHRGQFGIAPCLARRNAAQRPPHALLKRGAAQIERQIQCLLRFLQEIEHRTTALGQRRIVGDHSRARKPLTQITEQRLVRFGEADEADALVGGADQQPAERTVGEGGADHLPFARRGAAAPGVIPSSSPVFS